EASSYATKALRLASEIGDRYFLPGQLLTIAKVRKAEGKPMAALDCLDQATDIVEGLLANVGTPERASMLIHTMSSVYTYQFELAAQANMSADYLFRVVERARGRALSDVISLGRVTGQTQPSRERQRRERQLSHLQQSLLALHNRNDREAT